MSVLIRVDRDIARKIKDTQNKLGCSSSVASRILYQKSKPFSIRKLLKTELNEIDIVLIKKRNRDRITV